MKKSGLLIKDSLWALGAGLVLGVVISAISPGGFWLGWLKCGVLSTLLTLGLIRVWRLTGAGRTLALLMLVTFVIRIGFGLFLNQGLPQLGFDNPVQNSGYVFSDAHDRDQAAYQMAVSDKAWLPQIKANIAADQYGGLLTLSALIYWVFSADVHRPLLMVLFSAAVMAAGLAFLFAAVNRKWGAKMAMIAAWIYALYPDGVLLGSSQMREPILIGLTCLLLWSVVDWKSKPIRSLVFALIISAVICLFSIPGAGAAFTVILGLVFFEWLQDQSNPRTRKMALLVFAVFLGLVGVAGWLWLKNGLSYEYFITQSGSGWITALLEQYGNQFQIPFITFYGLTQPLLPAALVDSSLPIWKGIAIFRAAGWYFIIPFLLYGFIAIFKAEKEENRAVLIFLGLALAAWILISSLRAGGDQWDNPRYRTTFLPWIAILAAWVCLRVRQQKRPWFWRIVAVEVIFVVVFLDWYLYRNFNFGPLIPFPVLMLFLGGTSVLILIGGLVWDKKTTGKKLR
ncbi:MAG: hypothetical protein C0410_03070 [Anaerolinea sp.]|nr:hypothetical protein [Anaerolinea sp.]